MHTRLIHTPQYPRSTLSFTYVCGWVGGEGINAHGIYYTYLQFYWSSAYEQLLSSPSVCVVKTLTNLLR